MSGTGLKSEAMSAFLFGTGRRRSDYSRLIGGAIPANDQKADLKAAALLAQALRVERPSAPEAFVVEAASSGRRKLIAEDLRAPFVRLFGDSKFAVPPQDDLALGMALTLERLYLAPHPFDFHRLDGFLRAHAERLGADVLAWIDRDKKVEERRDYFDLETLSDENWTDATPVRRVRYIDERRRSDPGAARALVESVWSGESADLRLRLLKPFGVGLGPDDRPFLEGLANDRAPKVRELAARLLARLPGAAGEIPALQEILGRIRIGTSGFFRKRARLTMELPATVAKDSWAEWVRETFVEIDLGECVSALGMTADEAIAASGDDAPLVAAFVLMAARSRDFDLVSRTAKAKSIPYLMLWTGFFADGLDFSQTERLAFAEAVFQPGPNEGGGHLNRALEQLFKLTETPVDPATFDAILAEAGGQWKDGGDAPDLALLTSLTVLAPASRHSAVRPFVARLAEKGDRFLAYLDLVAGLERTIAHE